MMRTILILFFDDGSIFSRQGIDRRWFPAEPWPDLAPWHDPRLAWSAVSAVLREPEARGLSARKWCGDVLALALAGGPGRRFTAPSGSPGDPRDADANG
jgi:hypothetical protein